MLSGFAGSFAHLFSGCTKSPVFELGDGKRRRDRSACGDAGDSYCQRLLLHHAANRILHGGLRLVSEPSGLLRGTTGDILGIIRN